MRLQKSSKDAATIRAATVIDLKQKYDASTVAVMRQALNEVVTDRRFLVRKSVTPLEVAEHNTAYSIPAFSDQTIACLQCFPVES